jgi:hypothetical protein
VRIDADVVQMIGARVAAQSLMSRADAARELAACQRARMQRGEPILGGTVVRFEGRGDGVATDGVYHRRAHWFGVPPHGRPCISARSRTEARSDRADEEGYAFRFGEEEGADATDRVVERLRPGLMDPAEWAVLVPGAATS